MRIAWTTDLHLNIASDSDIEQFIEEVQAVLPDAVLVGGDIGEEDSFAAYLEHITAVLGLPVYFVLGNHDYYKGSICGVRESASALNQQSNLLHWLSDLGPIWLTERTALVGHGGWGDARAANFLKSDVILNDYLLIQELREASSDGDVPSFENILSKDMMAALMSLGDEAATHFRSALPEALEQCDHVFVLMHVPPFRAACWHNGHLSDDNWAPHFTCVAAGEVLLEFMEHYPQKRMTVLCGHTHSSGYVQICDNLEVFTGDAQYGQPKVQQMFDVA